MNELWRIYPKPSELFELYEQSVDASDNLEQHFQLYRIWVTLEPGFLKRMIHLGACLAGGKREKLAEQMGIAGDSLGSILHTASINLLDLYRLLKPLCDEKRYDSILRLLDDSEGISKNTERSALLLRLALGACPSNDTIRGKVSHIGHPPRCLSSDELKECLGLVRPFIKNGKKDILQFNITQVEERRIQTMSLLRGHKRGNPWLTLQIIKILHASDKPLNTNQILDRLATNESPARVSASLLRDRGCGYSFFKRLQMGSIGYWALAAETEKHSLSLCKP